jgi:hypothetical protein
MADYTINPYVGFSRAKLENLHNIMSYDADTGKVSVYRHSFNKTLAILAIGGQNDRLESSADREIDSTVTKTTKREGLKTNPFVLFPSTFFTPLPPYLHGSFAGPLSVIDNPSLIISILAVVAASRGDDEDSYEVYYKNLPTKVIDNEELEIALFGE